MKYTILVCMVLILVTSLTSFAADPDLVIYYSFDNFNNIVPDESGKGHDGKIVGEIKPDTEAKRGGSAKFTKGAYLDLDGPNFPSSDIPVDAMTLCAWAKPENTGDHHAIFNARASDQTWLVHPEFRSDGKVRWLLRAAGGQTIFNIQDGQWNPDQWIHFAGVYSSEIGQAVLYLNGEKIAEAQGNAKIASDWGLGARVGRNIDDARPFAGLMDDFCMFKKALTQAEIQELMVVGPPSAAPVSYKQKVTSTWGEIKNR